MADVSKVVMVVCADRGMQESLRRIVEAAGCQPLLAPSVDAAVRMRGEHPLVLVLVDPLLEVASRAVLDRPGECPVVQVPVRTSSTGVRRIAKRNQAAVRWLMGLVAERCAAQTA